MRALGSQEKTTLKGMQPKAYDNVSSGQLGEDDFDRAEPVTVSPTRSKA